MNSGREEGSFYHLHSVVTLLGDVTVPPTERRVHYTSSYSCSHDLSLEPALTKSLATCGQQNKLQRRTWGQTVSTELWRTYLALLLLNSAPCSPANIVCLLFGAEQGVCSFRAFYVEISCLVLESTRRAVRVNPKQWPRRSLFLSLNAAISLERGGKKRAFEFKRNMRKTTSSLHERCALEHMMVCRSVASASTEICEACRCTDSVGMKHQYLKRSDNDKPQFQCLNRHEQDCELDSLVLQQDVTHDKKSEETVSTG